MSEPPDPSPGPTGGDIVGSATLGGFVASGVAELIKFLPADSSYKPVATALVPWIAVIVSSAFLWARQWIKKIVAARQSQAAIKTARETLEQRIADPATPAAKKDDYLKQLGELDDQIVASQIDRARSALPRRRPPA